MRPKEYEITKEELKDLHLEQNLTPTEISNYYGCSRSTIYHYFRKWDIPKQPKYERLQGKEFGRLKVKKFKGINDQRQAEWICECSCGNQTIVTTANLKFGKVKSCGCLQKDKTTKHNMSGTRPYRIWIGMKSRCDNSDAWNYERYGGRGISYTGRWENFREFWEDMEDGYTENLTLERIDNEKDYSPNNCKWATVKEQARNKRNSVKLTYNGKTLTASEWADKINIPLQSIYARVKQGWSDERVLTT